MWRWNRCILREMFYNYCLCVLILYILPIVCMVLVCLWSPLQWLNQSNLVTCQLPWNWLIHQMWYQYIVFNTWNALFVSNHSDDDVVHRTPSIDMCWNFIKVIVPVTNVGAFLTLPSQVCILRLITNLYIPEANKSKLLLLKEDFGSFGNTLFCFLAESQMRGLLPLSTVSLA